MLLGFKTSPENTTWEQLRAVWVEADDIEIFDVGWNFDHFYPVYSERSGPCIEAWTSLAALSQATRRVRLGCLVTGVLYRHPAVLANMAAAVDIMSGGRLELGLGAGWMEPECKAYGIELGTIAERFDRFDEACEVLSGLLTRSQTTFHGSYYDLTDAYCEPKGVQQPPPITIGGIGEKRLLRAVARFADWWNLPAWDRDLYRRLLDVLAGHCAEIGRDPNEIRTSAHLYVAAGTEASQVAEQVADCYDAGLDQPIVYFQPPLDPAVLAPIATAVEPLKGER
ncbi:MAG: LLM class F420-dependent oxidoreductase [Actinobacteria bacterium]|nr:MAG: LLM class F420-dependent oxidoreductase [Actinomycetota bacterium]RIK06776.1 MAG: LLM class F420-dependent oxidoreductase [Acidobacteriota bacterium]